MYELQTQEDYQPEPTDDLLMFPRKNGVREATLLLVREKSGRYSLLRVCKLMKSTEIYFANLETKLNQINSYSFYYLGIF